MADQKAEQDAVMAWMETVSKVLGEVSEERVRQQIKWGEQNHPNGTGPYALPALSAGRHRYAVGLARWAKATTDAASERGAVTYADILTEEWAEAMAESDPARLRAELIQVAAVAAAWVEKIDRDLGTPPGAQR